MPSTNSWVVSRVLPSSTVMTPSLPTFSMASAMMRPISSSLLAAMVATFSRSLLLLTGMDIFLSFSTMSIAAFGAERDLDGAGELGDALTHGVAGFLIEGDLLGCHFVIPFVMMEPVVISQNKAAWERLGN